MDYRICHARERDLRKFASVCTYAAIAGRVSCVWEVSAAFLVLFRSHSFHFFGRSFVSAAAVDGARRAGSVAGGDVCWTDPLR